MRRGYLLQGFVPFSNSLLLHEALAGLTLAALAIPEVMGYTKIAGTPVITGLYTMLVPMFLYALFGSSRHLVVGADSATAAILAAGIAGMAAPRSAEWVALAGILALMTAFFLFLARFARLGFLADFLSRTVLIGFLSGVGMQVALGELASLLGLPHDGPRTLFHAVAAPGFIARIPLPDAAVAIAVLAVILGARRISPRLPGPLMAVLLAIAASRLFDLGSHGVHLLGPLPGGLPYPALPDGIGNWQLLQKLAPTAFAMFVVILSQSAATARAYAMRYNEPFDEHVDLVGLALANVGAGLTGTFVVNGSPTKTQMVDSAGGRSQLAQIVAGLLAVLVLLCFTGLLAALPTAVLSAVVLLIGCELIDLRGMRKICRERPWEFWVALATALAVVLTGVEKSILFAIVMSLIVHTRHGYRMNNMVLVADAEHGWHQQKASPEGQLAPGLMIYRFMHNLYYANTQRLMAEVNRLVDQADPPLRWFCLDGAAINDVDFTAAEALRRLHEVLAGKGVRLVFCELVDEVTVEFDRSRLTERFGRDALFPSPAAALAAYRQENRAVEPAA